MRDLLCYLLSAYILVLFVRIILSWFPIQHGSAMAQIFTVLYRLTEPVLGPVRRALPPMGGFDLSPIVVFFAIEIIQSIVLDCRVSLL